MVRPEQTVQSNFLTQANMIAQSDTLLASGLQAHGFRYINRSIVPKSWSSLEQLERAEWKINNKYLSRT